MTAAHVAKLATLARCPVCGTPYNDGLSYTCLLYTSDAADE